MVSWNTRERILAALRSVSRIRGLSFEILVIDNDSADDSADAVSREFPEVRLFRNAHNLGFAAGVNLGLREARHPLILLLNPDTIVSDRAIELLASYAYHHPEAGIIGPRVLNEDGSLQDSRISFPSELNLLLQATYLYKLFPKSRLFNPEQIGGHAPLASRPVNAVSGSCLLVRRETIEAIGVMDEQFFMYFEEVDLCYRAWERGIEVHYTPEPTITHSGSGSSRLAARKMRIEFHRSALRFFFKHHGASRAQIARFLLLSFLVLRVPYWGLRTLFPSPHRKRNTERLVAYTHTASFLCQPLRKILAPTPTP
jgi:N-acetylglucosaminyl-diphospho-decaprenol L-rhamnosyltransferase